MKSQNFLIWCHQEFITATHSSVSQRDQVAIDWRQKCIQITIIGHTWGIFCKFVITEFKLHKMSKYFHKFLKYSFAVGKQNNFYLIWSLKWRGNDNKREFTFEIWIIKIVIFISNCSSIIKWNEIPMSSKKIFFLFLRSTRAVWLCLRLIACIGG